MSINSTRKRNLEHFSSNFRNLVYVRYIGQITPCEAPEADLREKKTLSA